MQIEMHGGKCRLRCFITLQFGPYLLPLVQMQRQVDVSPSTKQKHSSAAVLKHVPGSFGCSGGRCNAVLAVKLQKMFR